MSYIECPQCGQKALSVATRCPRCGHNYPPQPLWQQASRPALSRVRPLLPITGVLVAGVILVVLIGRLAGRATTTPASRNHAVLTGRPPDQPQPVATAGGSAPKAAPSPAPPPSRPPPPQSPGVRRYARTWVNIRRDRALGAPAVRVLKPGEVVIVDSLRRGWYRVLAEGRTVGYVHRWNLDTAPPLARP